MKEPQFIKLYTNDLSILKNITKGANNLLIELIQTYLDYGNVLNLNASIKRKLAKKLNTNEQVIRQQISNLTKKKILIRLDTGLYILNPSIIGKGHWKYTQELIKEIENKETQND